MTRKLAFAVALAGLGPLAPVTSAFAAGTEVTIENFTFKPTQVSVAKGATVTFRNVDDIPHSVVASDGSFHSKALDTGDEFTHTFTASGEFAFFCGLHPFMRGKVTVVP